jgi:hypothetical protein
MIVAAGVGEARLGQSWLLPRPLRRIVFEEDGQADVPIYKLGWWGFSARSAPPPKRPTLQQEQRNAYQKANQGRRRGAPAYRAEAG